MMKFIRGKSASTPCTPKKELDNKKSSTDLHNKPSALAYDSKLNLLAIGNRTGTIKIYGKNGLELQSSFETSNARISQLIFIEGTGRLLCLCEDSSIHLWEILTVDAVDEKNVPIKHLVRSKMCNFFRPPRIIKSLPPLLSTVKTTTNTKELINKHQNVSKTVNCETTKNRSASNCSLSACSSSDCSSSDCSIPECSTPNLSESSCSSPVTQKKAIIGGDADSVDSGRASPRTSLPATPPKLVRQTWPHEILSFTISAQGQYALIVTRMGEMFMLDTQQFELTTQHSFSELVAASQLTAQNTINHFSSQRTHCGSDFNLNSSCNDSVISCSNSTISTISSNASLEDTRSLHELDLAEQRTVNNTRASFHHASGLLLGWNTGDRFEQSVRQTRQHMVKIYTSILCSEVEYKTLSITNETTSKQVICMLLNKFKMKHRDPNLFYLTMEIRIKKSGVAIKNVMVLNDESCPIQLKSCYPHEDTKFCLMMKNGGLVKVYDSCLMSGSLYKSVLLSESTNAQELVQLILYCYNCKDLASNYSLFEISKNNSVKLRDQDLPLAIQNKWNDKENCFFQLRRNKQEVAVALPVKKYAYNRPVTEKISSTTYNDYENYFYI